MSKIRFGVDVDGKKVGRKIKRRIEDGIDSAASDINDGMRKAAKQKIRDKNAIFRGELLEGFVNSKVTFGDSTVASLRNLSEHAPYQDRGVSGTEKNRNTPYKYKTKKPPLASLIPWVEQNLNGLYWPEDDLGPPPADFYGGNASSPSRPAGGSGGVTVGTDNDIPLDEMGLYDGDPGYFTHDMNLSFDNRWLFPEQKIVVYDTQKKNYERATVVKFRGEIDKTVTIRIEDSLGLTYRIKTDNKDPYKLVGYEDFDQLDEADLQARLKSYFDSAIRGSEDTILNKSYASRKGLVAPDSDMLDWLRDKWTTDIWDLYKDKWYVKEQLRTLTAVVGYTDSKAKRWLGAIGPFNDSPKYFGIFLSPDQIRNNKKKNLDWYLDTLKHETTHALSSSNWFGYEGRKSYGPDIAKWGVFSRDGTEVTGRTADDSGKTIKLPKDATLQMFHYQDSGNRGVVGGTDWIGEAYDAARSGESGIQSYEPDFKISRDKPLSRLHEAANYAYWLQTVAITEERGTPGNDMPNKDRFYVQRAYSITNAEETLATFTEVMSSEYKDYEKRIRLIHEFYPWLIEAWLEVMNPADNATIVLRDLGYNV